MNFRRLRFLIGILAGAGCSSMPDVTVSYFLPRLDLDLTIIQTAACSAAKESAPVLVNDVVIAPRYSRNAKRHLRLRDLDGRLSSGDIALSFYEDGRLKSINSAQTGQGTETVKALLSVLDTVGIRDAAMSAQQRESACRSLRQISDEAVTVRHTAMLSFREGETVEVVRRSLTDKQFESVRAIFGEKIEVTYELRQGATICDARRKLNGVNYCGDPANARHSTPLYLLAPGLARVKVTVGPQGSPPFQFEVAVPQLGQEYGIPIPDAPLFGATRFGIELSASGRVTMLKYGKSSGIAAALGSADAIGQSLSGATAAEKAAALEAEANLIFQQQRLVRCQADPSKCE